MCAETLALVIHMAYNSLMNNSQISIRTDDSTKQSIAEFADSIGMSTGAFMIAAAREAMSRGSVTLGKPEPKYNPKFIEMIREAEAEYERGEYYSADTPEESIALLKSWMKKKK